jgi:hypothetical protein
MRALSHVDEWTAEDEKAFRSIPLADLRGGPASNRPYWDALRRRWIREHSLQHRFRHRLPSKRYANRQRGP